MSLNPNSSDLLSRTIDLTYANKKRSNSLKWSVVNAVFFLIFAYDLSCKCPGYTTVLHYVEYLLAGVLGANLLQHALRLLPRREPPLALTLQQQRLLGLSSADLDSSFHVVEHDITECSENSPTGVSEADTLSVSVSPARRLWRSHSPHTLHSSSSRRSPLSTSHSPQWHEQIVKDEFIADQHSLSDYLKEFETRSRQSPPATAARPTWGAPTPPHYQLSSLDSDSSKLEEGSPAGSPQVWWRLQLDPQRVTQWNLNLRLWIHLTILERLVKEMDTIDETLAKHGLPDVRCGQVSAERLRATAGAVGTTSSVGGSLRALLPFLEPFPDQRYIVQRIRELASGGCMSNYKWNGGGSDWDDNRPTDAELVLHLVSAYLDGQLPSGGRAAPFSSEHLTAAPASPPRGAHALAIHRVTRRPPRYVLALGDDTLEVSRGRNNLLHTLVLFVAAAAPTLRRVHLGPAGLNMLWIIGR